jgi:hypothetical protein
MSHQAIYFLAALMGGIYLSAILLVMRAISGRPAWLWVLAPAAVGYVLASYDWMWSLLRWYLDAQNKWSYPALAALILLLVSAAVIAWIRHSAARSARWP